MLETKGCSVGVWTILLQQDPLSTPKAPLPLLPLINLGEVVPGHHSPVLGKGCVAAAATGKFVG